MSCAQSIFSSCIFSLEQLCSCNQIYILCLMYNIAPSFLCLKTSHFILSCGGHISLFYLIIQWPQRLISFYHIKAIKTYLISLHSGHKSLSHLIAQQLYGPDYLISFHRLQFRAPHLVSSSIAYSLSSYHITDGLGSFIVGVIIASYVSNRVFQQLFSFNISNRP